MPPQFIRAYRAETEDANDDGPIMFTASTEVVARDGLVIDAEGWDLAAFKRNNLVLWSHDYFGTRPPIGKAEANIDKEARELKADITFDMADPFAADIARKVREGFLNAVSVGFDIKEMDESGRRVTKAELLEISVVPIPADPKALAERMQRGLTSDLSDLLSRLTDSTTQDPADSSEFVWPGVALQMARLYLDTSDDDETREAQYRRLEREYRRLGKEAPEWMARSQLSLLDEPRIRGLFGAGEAELLGWEPDVERKGAVLSARNLGDLDQIIGLAQGIKERAVKESEATESEQDTSRMFLGKLLDEMPYGMASALPEARELLRVLAAS